MNENDEKVVTENSEQPSEEIKSEQPEEIKEESNPNLQTIEKADEDAEPYDVVIENDRKALFAEYNKSRKVSNILTVIVLVIAVGAMILITQQDVAMTIIGWCLAGATVVGLLLYYALTKNKFPNKTRDYIKKITVSLNQRTFADEKFTDLVTDPTEKVAVEDMVGDDVYDTLGNIASRNVVRGKYNGKDFMYGEVALNKAGATKKDAPLFVGKYISISNKLQMKGRVIINLKKAENPVDLPTKVGDLEVLKETPDFVVYGIKSNDFENNLGTEFLSKIKQLMPVDHLMNTNVVIWGGKTGIYLSYDDESMALPFDKPFNKAANEQIVENLLVGLECNEILGK